MLPPPTEQDLRDDRQVARMSLAVQDSSDSEHEQVEFTDDFPKSSKAPKNARPVITRPPRHKQRKQFATKGHMISLIEQVCSAQDAVIQQKRAQEGEAFKRRLQRNEASQARKSKREAKLEKIKTKLRGKKGNRQDKRGSTEAKEEEKGKEVKKDWRGHKKKRVSFKE